METETEETDDELAAALRYAAKRAIARGESVLSELLIKAAARIVSQQRTIKELQPRKEIKDGCF